MVLGLGSEAALYGGLFLVDLGGDSGTLSFPLVPSLSKTIDGFDAIEGGLDVSVALGDPGIGASCTLIAVCRFEAEGYDLRCEG